MKEGALMVREMYKYSFFAQEPELSAEPIQVLAEIDESASYEIDMFAVFKLANNRYAYIAVSGCSCWPDRGGTVVYEDTALDGLQKQVHGNDNAYNPSFRSEYELFSEARRKDGQQEEGVKWYERVR
jgi:hypothetical protein